jgi:hypothetical protein
MTTIDAVESESTGFWTDGRVRLAGVAGIVGGVLYALSYLENNTPLFTREENLLGYAFIALVALTSYVLLGFALNGFHAVYGERYGRIGRYLVGLAILTLGLMVVGGAVNAVFPSIADPAQEGATLGGTTWGLAMFATLILMTGYGVVLWRADAIRLGAALLMVNLVLVIGALVVFDLLGGPVVTTLGWLAFGGPLGLAWVVLGRSLLGPDDDAPTITATA